MYSFSMFSNEPDIHGGGFTLFRSTDRRLAAATAGAMGLSMLIATSASAAVDDSFTVYTSDHCASAQFVDYGTWKDGSTRDDFFILHDLCGDGHGTSMDILIDGSDNYQVYNGNGVAGAPVYWDGTDNLYMDDIEIWVCTVDGPRDRAGQGSDTARS